MNLYAALVEAIRGIKSTPLAFVASGLVLFVISFIVLLSFDARDSTPFYVLLGVSGALIVAGLLFSTVARRRSPTGGKKDVDSTKGLKRILQEAEITLRHLEAKAAAIPVTERSITLTRDLETQRDLVDGLRDQLAGSEGDQLAGPEAIRG